MGKCEEQNQLRTKKKKKQNERIQHTITTIKCVHVAAVAAVDDDDGNGAAVRHKSSRHFPLSRDDARALVNKPHWSCAEREIVFYFTPKLVSTAPNRTTGTKARGESIYLNSRAHIYVWMLAAMCSDSQVCIIYVECYRAHSAQPQSFSMATTAALQQPQQRLTLQKDINLHTIHNRTRCRLT